MDELRNYSPKSNEKSNLDRGDDKNKKYAPIEHQKSRYPQP